MTRWLLILLLATGTRAADWPHFLGPGRDGVYPGGDLAKSWPKEGPAVRWQTKTGAGFSGPVVVSGKLILFHRLADKEIVDCFDAKKGTRLWRFDYPTRYQDDFGFDEGPRSTPAIADGRVFVYGAEGMLHALDLNSGKKFWSVDAKKDFGAPKGFFGIACSPLVEGQAVLLNVGGQPDAGIVAFDAEKGTVLWKGTRHEPSYSSPVAATIRGRRYALILTRDALVAADPATGKVFFEFPFSPTIRSSVTAATPLVIEDRVFLSASYGAGAVMLKFGAAALEQVWANDELSNHYATSIYHGGFLYGIDGRTDPGMNPTLRCVDASNGKVRWEKPFEAATLIRAGDQILLLTERGELVRAAADPTGFKPNARAQILPAQTRAHPALADGLFYARSKEKLVCVDLSAPTPP
jgi:outer membrane protein assembly factor BamB